MAYDILKAAVAATLARLPVVEPETIRTTIQSLSGIPPFDVSDLEAEQLARELEVSLDVTMETGSVVQEEFTPWLSEAKSEINPYYWERYTQFLGSRGFPPRVVAKLDDVTDRIVGLLQDPRKDGPWDRRGMVVGHVQSGKTANYIGVINKAADAGYRLAIVIAGIHNNLRNQTQERIDEGFIGRDSSRLEAKREDREIGVGRFDARFPPLTVTTCVRDFNRNTAHAFNMELKAISRPFVLVIKKNASTLDNVINWLKEHNASGSKIKDAPMLLIDDEADNASIDISSSPDKASRINSQIRQLLNLFDKKCYLGYTATPFANIFIDPATEDEMLQADLFPKDFIISLDPPTNYFGSTRIFSENPECDVVKEIDDNQDLLPTKHKKDLEIVGLPPSMEEAIRAFIVARAVRLLRGHRRSHSSMLVNVSRFTDVQRQLRDVIHDHVSKIARRIRFEAGKPSKKALEDDVISDLHNTWKREYGDLEFSWDDIQGKLHEAVSPIQVVEVNSRSSGSLNYRDHADSGLNVIAVGGFSLSRGLTLEGLLTSYFLRNSMMYDTLMQMGRWFGYRPGYEDLCRIWMTDEASGWYEHITESMEELRAEIRDMERANLTPKEFGLKVRSHPDALIVTARNKMRSAEKVMVRIGLANEFIETHTVWRDEDKLESNRRALTSLVSNLGGAATYASKLSLHKNNYFWNTVEVEHVLEFIGSFQNHPLSMLTDSGPVRTYIEKRADDEMSEWDVVLINKGDPTNPSADDSVDHELFGFPVVCQQRSPGARTDQQTIRIGSKQRVASRPIEDIGLEPDVKRAAEKEFREDPRNREKASFPDWIYRSRRKRPLLILHLLQIKGKEDPAPLADKVVAWGISFPRSSLPDPTVEYVVNMTWWRDRFRDEIDDDMDDEDE